VDIDFPKSIIHIQRRDGMLSVVTYRHKVPIEICDTFS
jgi:hypothetical protein